MLTGFLTVHFNKIKSSSKNRKNPLKDRIGERLNYLTLMRNVLNKVIVFRKLSEFQIIPNSIPIQVQIGQCEFLRFCYTRGLQVAAVNCLT